MHDSNSSLKYNPNHTLDTTGLICPEPVMLLHKKIRQATAGDTIQVIATDPATTRDIPNFCRHLGHTLLEETINTDQENDGEIGKEQTLYQYLIQKKS